MADLNQSRGTKPQNFGNKVFHSGKKLGNAVGKSFDRRAVFVGKQAEKVAKFADKNIFEGLNAEEHRKALIEACVNTDNIFDEHIDDPPEKASEDFKDYMFYNQLYFLAAAQIMQPDETGSLLPGIIGGLSVVAGAALVSKDFRKNLTEHVEDTLLKYIEPFKDSAPKAWRQLSINVESHPGCISPESAALKLLRYQRQAADKVASGSLSAKEADDLLCKKVAEIKAATEEMNIPWSDIVEKRNDLAKDLSKMDTDRKKISPDNWKSEIKNHMNSRCPEWSEKTGFDNNEWSTASDWSAPIDVKSVAERLMSYQDQLQEISTCIASNSSVDTKKYTEYVDCTESESLMLSLKEVNQLKQFATKTLGLDWNDVAEEYNRMNQSHYDELRNQKKAYYDYIDPPNQHKYLEDGTLNENFAKPNDKYYADLAKRKKMFMQQERTGQIFDNIPNVPTLNKEGRMIGLIKADDKIREHNKRMYYELPVDAASAGRCLKKYQQEAYNSVRDAHDRVHNYSVDSIDSTKAYDLANDMCKGVKIASDTIGFDWKDAIKSYRKDVYSSILDHPNKNSIWKEMVDDDIIANIPTSATSYVTENGKTTKRVRELNRHEAIDAWDGVIYNSDGSRADDNVLMHVRNPYTEDEASHAMYNLFVDDFKLRLQKSSIQENYGTKKDDTVVFKDSKYQRQVDSIDDKINNIAERREKLVSALVSDKFDEELIDKIEQTAIQWFEEAKTKMPKASKSETIDESLAPHDAPDDNDEFQL